MNSAPPDVGAGHDALVVVEDVLDVEVDDELVDELVDEVLVDDVEVDVVEVDVVDDVDVVVPVAVTVVVAWTSSGKHPSQRSTIVGSAGGVNASVWHGGAMPPSRFMSGLLPSAGTRKFTPPSGHVPLPMLSAAVGGRVASTLSQYVPKAASATSADGVAGSPRFVAPNWANDESAVMTSNRRQRLADPWEPTCRMMVGMNVGLFARK